MPDLKDVHARMRQKQKEQSEIKKMFKDTLLHDAKYQEILDTVKKLREQKKSIENQAWASSRTEADKLDLLALDIKSDKEMLASIALNMYVAGKTVEVVDEYNTRWVPQFSVTFTKDVENVEDLNKPVAVEQVV
jgi:endonuclease III-like uncharacterized protein